MPQLTCWPFLFATIWHISSAKMKKRKSQTQWDRELAHLLSARLPNHYYTKAAFTLLHNPPFLNLLSPPLSALGEEVILQPDYGCVFFEQTTKYEPLREKMQGKDVKEASSTSSSWQGKESSRPPRQVRLESQKPHSRSPLTNTHQWACPLRRKWLTIKVLSSNTEQWRGKDHCRLALREHTLMHWSTFYRACHHNELTPVLNHRGDTGYKYIIDLKSTGLQWTSTSSY